MVLVLGVDAGGTASRALLATADGTPVGRGAAGPGNPCALGPAAATAIGAAVRQALGDHDPASVARLVVGVAGISGLADPATAEAFRLQWKTIGLTCDVTVVGDAVTAYAAGATAPRGCVLIAGTGAVAALVRDGAVERTADGWGWLLGDEGSGAWLGLQAVRAAVRDWSAPLSVAVAAVARAGSPDALAGWAARQPPAAFAALAPLVCTSDDPAATAIVTEAARRLVATLDRLDAPETPVVLAGGLLTADTPVRRRVLAALRGRQVGISGDPVRGAVRLATHLPPAP
jgi:N-acetylglucosamine kinase-like BadF-type ATPase